MVLDQQYVDLKSSPRVYKVLQTIVEDKGIGRNGHAFRVAEYTNAICSALGMSAEKARWVADAALLHDIGKIVIPERLLDKKERLEDKEFDLIRNHTIYGAQIVMGDSEFQKLAAKIAKEHHERIDGSGYFGLKNNEICLEARIVAVADVFDALTEPRMYKKTWSFDSGFRYISERSGSEFDEKVVKAFNKAKSRIKEIYDAERESRWKIRVESLK